MEEFSGFLCPAFDSVELYSFKFDEVLNEVADTCGKFLVELEAFYIS